MMPEWCWSLSWPHSRTWRMTACRRTGWATFLVFTQSGINCERWPYCGVPPLSGQETWMIHWPSYTYQCMDVRSHFVRPENRMVVQCYAYLPRKGLASCWWSHSPAVQSALFGRNSAEGSRSIELVAQDCLCRHYYSSSQWVLDCIGFSWAVMWTPTAWHGILSPLSEARRLARWSVNWWH